MVTDCISDDSLRIAVQHGREIDEPVPRRNVGDDALLAVKDATDAAGNGLYPAGILAENKRLIRAAALIGQQTTGTSPPGSVSQKHRALARRITRRLDDYLRFATDPAIPFDNNLAERDIRPAKTKIKIAGGLRSMGGATVFATLRSYLSTCQKNAVNLYDALIDAATGHPWTPATT